VSAIPLKKLLFKLQGVSKKKELDHKDLNILREIKAGIAQTLAILKVCDACGKAVVEIARLEIDGVRAAVCTPCGIKALRTKNLELNHLKRHPGRAAKRDPKPRRKNRHSGRPAPSPHPSPRTPIGLPKVKRFPVKPGPITMPKAKKAPHKPDVQTALSLSAPSNGASQNDAFQAVADRAKTTMGVIKKIYHIASSVAIPMDIDRTVNYTRMEAQRMGIKAESLNLRQVMEGLVKKAGLKLKR